MRGGAPALSATEFERRATEGNGDGKWLSSLHVVEADGHVPVGQWLATQGAVWGEEVVGARLAVYWTDDGVYYPGHVIAYKAATGKWTAQSLPPPPPSAAVRDGADEGSMGAGEHKILYDDKELEWVFLVLQTVHWLSQDATLVDGGASPAPAKAATAATTGSGGRRRRLEADLLVDALHTSSDTDPEAGASEATATQAARKGLRPQRGKAQPEEKGPTAILPGGCDVACGDVKGYLLPGGRRGDEWVRLKVRRHTPLSRVWISAMKLAQPHPVFACTMPGRVFDTVLFFLHAGPELTHGGGHAWWRSRMAPSTTRAAPPRW